MAKKKIQPKRRKTRYPFKLGETTCFEILKLTESQPGVVDRFRSWFYLQDMDEDKRAALPLFNPDKYPSTRGFSPEFLKYCQAFNEFAKAMDQAADKVKKMHS